jgi:hypothetical protein
VPERNSPSLVHLVSILKFDIFRFFPICSALFFVSLSRLPKYLPSKEK